MANIKGNQDGPNNRNETYDIGERKNVPKGQVVQEVKDGVHSGYHIYEINGQEYVRDNPDESVTDNVNRAEI